MNVIKNFITTSALEWARKEKEDGNSLAGFIIQHMEQQNRLRDAQQKALKVYLWLKCAKENKSLVELLEKDFPNDNTTPLASAFAKLGDELESESLKRYARKATTEDLKKFFIEFISGYDDIATWLFSLPMGAGKTYVMAAMIYIDLYFNLTADDKKFAKNFLIFAPSGLKSSVIPSLRTIEHFDPTWILPKDIAEQIKKQLKFVVLDVNKTEKKSNRIENPNARKVQACLKELDPNGYVFVTNAEKVILDKIIEDPYKGTLFEQNDDEKSQRANELRHLLGKVPSLTILIDEVHHNQKEENKLRLVIDKHFTKTAVSIIGFTGTPYFSRKTKIENITLSLDQIPNTVYHYELKNGVRNFLKQPIIKSFTSDTDTIVKSSLEDFYVKYYQSEYKDGRKPKLAIYCADIEKLEEQVLPLVTEFYHERGLDTNEILKYFGSNSKAKSGKKYTLEKDAEVEFNKLDTPYSKKRIVLLCQIGKEGWDCQSLAGVVLSGEGDSPKNMVLQTSCRCLREVDDAQEEKGLIYLNQDNYKHLEKELKDSHNITIREFEEGKEDFPRLLRFDRREHLKLPLITFNQFMVEYQCITKQQIINTNERLETFIETLKRKEQPYYKPQITTTRTDFEVRDESNTSIEALKFYSTPFSFAQFKASILRSSFGTITVSDIEAHVEIIEKIYRVFTHFGKLIDGFDVPLILSAIHQSFIPVASISANEKIDESTVEWLISDINKNALSETAKTYPENRDFINKINEYDKQRIDSETLTQQEDASIKQLEELKATRSGNPELVKTLALEIQSIQRSKLPIKNKDKSFHYIPYDFTASGFEREVLEKIFLLKTFQDQNLEVYFNGDRFLSEFKIKIYKKLGNTWKLIQNKYTPDFLIIQRNKKNEIVKTLIIETKGAHLAHDFSDIREFMRVKFVEINPNKFDFLYLEDGKDFNYQVEQIHDKMQKYFQ
ncbi:MAG: DEAD/DEAH box helicase family protein [Candidatus Levyibacteriota bacterium]